MQPITKAEFKLVAIAMIANTLKLQRTARTF